MKLLLTLPVQSSWYLAFVHLLKKHPSFIWTMHDILSTLITDANEQCPPKYAQSGTNELLNDFSKYIALKYNYLLHHTGPAKSPMDRAIDNDFGLSYQCIYPYDMRALQEAIRDGLYHYRNNHNLARELVIKGRAEYFVCAGIAGDTVCFLGKRYSYQPKPCVVNNSQTV